MSSAEQVADLVPGDVVELREDHYPDVVVRGALHLEGAALCLGRYLIRDGNGAPGGAWTLTVQSRAPYANHPRSEARPGDVVRDADDDTPDDVWVRTWGALPDRWAFANGGAIYEDAEMPKRLRLLVDGETGQVVQ